MSIPLFKPYFPKECRKSILSDMEEILTSGRLMMGPFKDKLEGLFAKTIGTPFAVSVNTCTTALTICLKYFDVAGHDVLVPSGTFLTSVSSVLFAGGRPLLVDMNPETLSFDLEDLERKITPATKGMIWVHLTGLISPEYDSILEFARAKGLFVIEDCAHALGAEVPFGRSGSLGHAGCFSFYPTKIITSGTGGMITTADEGLRKYAEKMRLFCKDPKTQSVDCLGNDWFLDEIRACVAYHHLTQLEEQLVRRREIAAQYERGLSGQKGLRLLDIPEGNASSFYQFPVFVDKSVDHQGIIRVLKEKYDIQTKKIYPPTHQENVFRELDNGTLAKTEDTLNRSLCLPLHVQMTDEEIARVVHALKTELG